MTSRGGYVLTRIGPSHTVTIPAGMSHQPDNVFAGTQVVSLVEVRGTNNPLATDGAARAYLLAVKRREIPWTEVDSWRKELHRDFERALAETKPPERPDYETANRFLIEAWREMANPTN